MGMIIPDSGTLAKSISEPRAFNDFRPSPSPPDASSSESLGLTPAKTASVASALELSRRLIRNELPHRPLLDDPSLVARHAAASYRSSDQQVLGAIFLDVNCRLISDAEIFRGALTAAAVEPGVVFRRALAASAAAVIVFQTRPSGDPVPTREDWSFTRRLLEAGEIVGVGVRDHLLVASAEQWVSLHRRHPWSGVKGWRGSSSVHESSSVPHDPGGARRERPPEDGPGSRKEL